MKILKNPIVMMVIGVVAGVMLSDTIKPMLAKIPFIGSFFGSAE